LWLLIVKKNKNYHSIGPVDCQVGVSIISMLVSLACMIFITEGS
jgi:hypothetical protein